MSLVYVYVVLMFIGDRAFMSVTQHETEMECLGAALLLRRDMSVAGISVKTDCFMVPVPKEAR